MDQEIEQQSQPKWRAELVQERQFLLMIGVIIAVITAVLVAVLFF